MNRCRSPPLYKDGKLNLKFYQTKVWNQEHGTEITEYIIPAHTTPGQSSYKAGPVWFPS